MKTTKLKRFSIKWNVCVQVFTKPDKWDLRVKLHVVHKSDGEAVRGKKGSYVQ